MNRRTQKKNKKYFFNYPYVFLAAEYKYHSHFRIFAKFDVPESKVSAKLNRDFSSYRDPELSRF